MFPDRNIRIPNFTKIAQSPFMPLRKIVFLLFIAFWHDAKCQNSLITTEIRQIDSLILYTNFPEAERRADSLYKILSEKRAKQTYMEPKLNVLLQKADINIRNFHYPEALKKILNILDEARESGLPAVEYKASLMGALIYEIMKDFDQCKVYLDKAYSICKKNNLDHLYSTYLIRSSSYYRLKNQEKKAIHLASKALHYATKYKNRADLSDSYLLLGMLLNKTDYRKAIQFDSLAARDFLERNNYAYSAAMYNNIAKVYLNHEEPQKALLSNKKSMDIFKLHPFASEYYVTVLKTRAYAFDSLNQTDSAYFYYQCYHELSAKTFADREAAEIRKISGKYENDKKEAVIRMKNWQINLILILLLVIVVASVIVLRKNRKIHSQNKIISRQVDELVKTLEQKQVLLSELQHRVKNNLQHVISILEIQKESVDFQNIDELIRENQNRIHSMALLHRKLNVSEHVSEVDLNKYITELAELVKDSYDSKKKKIQLDVQCEIDRISIEKALPVGLIIVELISNSMKHAFNNRRTGKITIQLEKDEMLHRNTLHYADDGIGYDFSKKSEKGLGIEIINGLTGQLGAEVETKEGKGFTLTICFK
ncbi:Blue-light-activated histidine kinase 2 [compost metagenome]